MKKKEQNIFEEIGFSKEEATVLELKAQLYAEIVKVVQKRKLSRRDLGKILDVPQPCISELMSGKLQGITSDKLTKYLYLLGRKVQIKTTKFERIEAP